MLTPGRLLHRRRVVVAGALTVVLFVTLAGRLVHLQVAQQPAYAARAEHNHVRLVAVDAPRGRILDRAGRVLADHRPAYRVLVDRRLSSQERTERLAALAPLVGVPAAELARRFADPRAAPLLPAPVADDVDAAAVAAIRERPGRFAGVVVERHPVRRFPHGTLAAHVLGAHRPGGGSFGVEAIAGDRLAGRPGRERVVVDSRGRVVGRGPDQAPVPGRDVTLTLDLGVQAAAEAALAEQLAAARARSAAPAGAAVVLDVRDGSLLALASAPTFDPALFVGRLPSQAWQAWRDPAAHAPLTNRAIQGTYAPGSTFKPVTALAGLGSGSVTTRTVIEDRGRHQVGGRWFRNAQSQAHGAVDLRRAMAVSSDVYFYLLGEQLHRTDRDGPIQDMARRLGFGRPTGVDLGGEAAGRVPGPGWRRAAHERDPGAVPDPRWYPGDSVNLSIGQGDLTVSPLQLAVAYGALVTGVPVPTPHVVASSPERRPGGPGAMTVDLGDIPAEHRAAVVAGLTAAVADRAGTAAAAFASFPLQRLPVAGKTGTAEVAGKADTALFAAVVPAGAPRYAVVVVAEEAGFGSVVAAPVARRIIEALPGLGR